MAMKAKPIPRPAARVIVFDESRRVLLFSAVDRAGQPFWFTPGGGLEPGETHEEAALRELREETGLTGVPLGPWVWKRRHVWRHGDARYDQRERYFLVETASFQLDLSRHTELERRELREHRWWSLEELSAPGLRAAPKRLVQLLAPLVHGIVPARPVDVGV
jgi:8-oxo-dGTP pyrophosphatase MutT (NUDIX family)